MRAGKSFPLAGRTPEIALRKPRRPDRRCPSHLPPCSGVHRVRWCQSAVTGYLPHSHALRCQAGTFVQPRWLHRRRLVLITIARHCSAQPKSAFVPPRCPHPLFPSPFRRRGDVMSSPSPGGRGGQGVRTQRVGELALPVAMEAHSSIEPPADQIAQLRVAELMASGIGPEGHRESQG